MLLQDLRQRFALPDEYLFPWRPRLADFGLANGYAELGVRSGSRPYLAPEQYDQKADLSNVDIFACGVMLHELLTGYHPIGEVTSKVWPEPLPGESSAWRHENNWKRWARSPDKLTPVRPRRTPATKYRPSIEMRLHHNHGFSERRGARVWEADWPRGNPLSVADPR